jgi:CHAT domain-containing protein
MVEAASDQSSSPLPSEKTKRRRRQTKAIRMVEGVDKEEQAAEKKGAETRKNLTAKVSPRLDEGRITSPDFKANMLKAEQLEAQRQGNPRVTARLIRVYKQIIRQMQPNENSLLYASIQHKLGDVYSDLVTGNQVAHLSQAIACYQEALRFRTPDVAPLDYADTQKNLGNAYRDLQTGNRFDNLTQAIACYQEALRFWTPETAPLDYAKVQYNLGVAYSDLPTGDRAANQMQAITCYQEALRFWTPETAPLDYADAVSNLGSAYSDLPTGDRTANLRQAITCYQEALRFWTPETAPLDYAKVQRLLGSAYWELPTEDQTTNLRQAITHYQEALRFQTPETAPWDYADTQTDLGNAYSDLQVGDRTANLRQAITCYQEALRFQTPETAPWDYARIQHCLGNAYSDLLTGDRTTNLRQAITHYQEALRFWTAENVPLDHATVQVGLGNAYSDLLTGDRTANLRQAITHYQEALRFWTAENVPLDHATVQVALGNAYLFLLAGDRTTNLKQAITHYQEALRFWTAENTPLDYALVQNNLGDVYLYLQAEDRAANLKQAITHYQEALRFWTAESMPLDYARAEFGVGLAYTDFLTGDRAANLRQAITHYQEALRFWTAESMPLDYATIQVGLGNAYRDLQAGDRAANLKQAIAHYQEALRFQTPEAAPLECRKTNRYLAELHFAQSEWHAALAAYRVAMDVGEQIYRTGLSAESKITEVAENALLYRQAAFAAVRGEEKREALLILERGKTRILSEALHLRISRPKNIHEEIWRTFEDARAAVRDAQSERIDLPSKERDLVQAYQAREQAVRTANAALDEAIELIRNYAPDFLHPIDFPVIQSLLDDEHTVLVAFCVTDRGSVGFVVGNNHDQDVRVVEVPDFTQSKLRQLFVERDADGRAIGGWLGTYERFIREQSLEAFDAWQSIIVHALAELSRHLLIPILSSLPSDVERIIFLPSAELFLLPLHAAPLGDNSLERVCDRYQIIYAPSVEVLVNTQAKALQSVKPNLYAVINPEADRRLIFTSSEGTAISHLFAQHCVDKGHLGTKTRVIAEALGRSYIHFACHGSYNWDNPAESGLELANGRLTLTELQSGDVDLSSARLVTLSACETGIIDVLKGSAEEYVGIPAGFLLAGVPCVVSSLWAVSDLSTALLMERFYHNHLNRGMEISSALRLAQLWVRGLSVGEVAKYAEQWYHQSQQKEKPELFRLMRYYRQQEKQNAGLHPFEHPYFWAAFTVNGS